MFFGSREVTVFYLDNLYVVFTAVLREFVVLFVLYLVDTPGDCSRLFFLSAPLLHTNSTDTRPSRESRFVALAPALDGLTTLLRFFSASTSNRCDRSAGTTLLSLWGPKN